MTELIHDGLILAAGKNTRLSGVVPSYYKPLVIVNGRPLIVNITRDLLQRCKNVVIVVSPENATPIADVLVANRLMEDTRVSLVVQPIAAGPGDAVDRGLRCVESSHVLIALGDNITPSSDFDAVLGERWRLGPIANYLVVSTTETDDAKQAQRFTRITSDGHFVEGMPGGQNKQGTYTCWIGPVSVEANALRKALCDLRLNTANSAAELKISPAFERVQNSIVVTVPGNSVDIGTSDALLTYGTES